MKQLSFRLTSLLLEFKLFNTVNSSHSPKKIFTSVLKGHLVAADGIRGRQRFQQTGGKL